MNNRHFLRTASALLGLLLLPTPANAFSGSQLQRRIPATLPQPPPPPTTTTTTTLYSSDPEYTREVRLREEAESPFRRVRFFLYASLGGGALTSLFLSLARIAAASSGINADLMQESLLNAGVDLAGLVVLGVLFQRDLAQQQTRLKRATKGASLAKLAIRISKSMADPLSQDDSFVGITLADLRRNRGIEKRVVIAAAGKETMDKVLQDATKFQDTLEESDLVIVPVVLPEAVAPVVPEGETLPRCVALPVGPAAWRAVMEDEKQEALKQNVDLQSEGFCVILKKNGRVGQRTRGIFLERMVGEVAARKGMGMDVTNI